MGRPSCTHMIMDRVHGSYICQVCLRMPEMGWVYVCKQDLELQGSFEGSKVPRPLPEITVTEPRDSVEGPTIDAATTVLQPLQPRTNCVSSMGAMNVQGTSDGKENEIRSPLAKELAELGLSRSVIESAEEGLYSEAQLEKLKQQKLHLAEVIKAAEQKDTPKESMRVSSASNSENVAPSGACILQHGSARPPRQQPCNFKCCHRCRPYYKDRAYVSFEAVFDGAVRPLTVEDMKLLPVVNAQTMVTIASRPTARSSFSPASSISLSPMETESLSSSLSHADDDNDLAANRAESNAVDEDNATSSTSDSGMRASIRRALQVISVRRRLESIAAGGSSVSLPAPGQASLVERGQAVRGQAISHARALNRGHCLATPSGRSRDSSFSDHVRDDASSGVEVNGGLALTEEAVETHTPDIITQQ
ncbi:hypothetical protein BDY21DRAFT_366852 [Lineolata rhizophorae]|uniref:Uncharacterized protein n=1 Tax=Lineolata rhizophorae TaxID=578093 RepID=A0A6A6NQI4_9PEZI|nr:hypothetical protein BDY21DRAFT_366852 [Lineolata rhizophorae]